MNVARTYHLLGLTKGQLHSLSGISYSVLWKWENDSKRLPLSVAEYLGALRFLKQQGLLENFWEWRAREREKETQNENC